MRGGRFAVAHRDDVKLGTKEIRGNPIEGRVRPLAARIWVRKGNMRCLECLWEMSVGGERTMDGGTYGIEVALIEYRSRRSCPRSVPVAVTRMSQQLWLIEQGGL